MLHLIQTLLQEKNRVFVPKTLITPNVLETITGNHLWTKVSFLEICLVMNHMLIYQNKEFSTLLLTELMI